MQMEEQKETAPEVPNRGLSPEQQELKLRLELKKNKDYHRRLTKYEQEELDHLVYLEKAEYERQALIHRLAEIGDKHARRVMAASRKSITDVVKKLDVSRKAELGIIHKQWGSAVSALDKSTKAAMRGIQEEHNKAKKALGDIKEEDEQVVHASYRGQLDALESQLLAEADAAADEAASFIQTIKELEVDQLQTLQSDGVLQLGEGSLSLPGKDPPA